MAEVFMIECVGRMIGGTGERITGRICLACDVGTEEQRTAKIMIYDGRTDPGELADGSTVGIMALGDDSADAVLRAECGIPLLVVDERYTEILPYMLHRIAILDCPGQRIYVDPSIDVINRYFGSLAALPPKRIPVLGMGAPFDGSEGMVTSAVGDEESVFDGLCELTERYAGSRIVVKMDMGDRMTEQMRGVLRAAVWGRISVVCDAMTPVVSDRYMEISHRAYYSLEKEGREFNGFIPKGIWVSTPMLLTSEPNRYADFFVLDTSALIDRFAGTDCDETAAARVMEHMADFALRTRDRRASLYASGRYSKPCAEYMCARNAVKEIYADMEALSGINRLIK